MNRKVLIIGAVILVGYLIYMYMKSKKPQAAVPSSLPTSTPIVSVTSTDAVMPVSNANPMKWEDQLIKSPSSPKVFYVVNGQKVWIDSPEAFEAQFGPESWSKIVVLDDTTVNAIPLSDKKITTQGVR